MTLALGPLYHWSPRERRKSIDRLGLVPGKRNVCGPVYRWDADGNESREEFRQPMLCFGVTPAVAWAYSNDVWKHPGTWDLWEVHLIDTDEVHVLSNYGPRIREVRVANRIKKSRLVWVGERTVKEAS